MAPITPGKRVTRARAAAKKTDVIDAPLRKTTESKVTKSTSTRKTEPVVEEPIDEPVSTKRVTSRTTIKPAPLAVAPRRRVRVTPLNTSVVKEDPVPEPVEDDQKAKKSTRNNKVTSKEVEEKAAEPKTKSRVRATRSEESSRQSSDVTVPKTRGRPKKSQEEQANIEQKSTKSTRQTRARSDSNAAPAESLVPPTANATTAARKKVTFQDATENDKENQPVPAKKGITKKDTVSATGMRAKPVRKPTVASSKKTATTTKKESKPIPRPLTPKKITQIAHVPTTEESEDEDVLNGAKTPIRDLSQSPKRNPVLAAQMSPVKKLDLVQSLFNKSPDRTMEHTVLQSPARRPPSPVKDTLQQSPRRGDLTTVFAHASQPAITATNALMPSTNQNMLLQSPKRAPIDASMFSNSIIKPSKSPFKASFLMSPAKRLFSPMKRTALAADRIESTTPADDKASDDQTLGDITVSSHFRASASPQRSARVYRVSNEELAEELRNDVDFDASILAIGSPVKLKKVPVIKEHDMPMETDHDRQTDEHHESSDNETQQTDDESLVQCDQPAAEEQEDTTSTTDDDNHATSEDPASDVGLQQEIKSDRKSSARDKKPRLSEILFRTARARDDESSSEDELAADETPVRPIGMFRSSLTGAKTRSRVSTGVKAASQAVSYTPLAVQMSGWLAVSPEKRAVENSKGTFSPLAAQHVPGEVQISRQSTPQQHKTVGGRKRKSVGARTSFIPSTAGSPENPSYFADQMVAQEIEDQMELAEEADDLHALVAANEAEQFSGDEDVEDQGEESVSDEGDTVLLPQSDGELTTDLIKFTNASDTALVDFAQLAHEADELASHAGELQSSSNSVYGDENAAPVSDSVRQDTNNDATSLSEADADAGRTTTENHVGISSEQAHDNAAVQDKLFSPSALAKSIEFATPARPDYGIPRFVNTVVSKVPLRPEGEVSPIKVQKKRSRSFTTDDIGSAKKINLSPSTAYGIRSASENVLSPERRIRSAAPSPAHTTPGQMSFVVDDFGDSTLDGIELPDEMDFDVTQTPATVKSYGTVATPTRAPLKAVGGGILHGAVVYVDVHTTEGADASSIFIELLTQMGARCVKEWKWNPRASLGESLKPGVTHVVYKDGGKRTLEKVRDAKGEVWCVGVGWVLDCERENKWLEEAPYAIDHSIMPRGGSRRRKSMEPRMLINENGSLSSKAGRRSVSGEMTDAMKEELINTPVRTYIPRQSLVSDFEGDTTEISSTYNSPTTHMNIGISTPTALVNWDPATAMTPAPMDTPYLMKEGSKLVQMTCPPKQTNKGIFDDSEKTEEKKAEKLKLKLAEARRKTMGWRPRVGSPLSKV